MKTSKILLNQQKSWPINALTVGVGAALIVALEQQQQRGRLAFPKITEIGQGRQLKCG